MVRMTKFVVIAALAAAGLTSAAAISSDGAEARRYHSASRCKGPIRGFATGQGILGKGTKEARKDARWDWESKATNAYGDAYGNFDKARGVRWDCKKGAILQAKCVVTARPCR